MNIWLVDAFTEKCYAGNPAAVAFVSHFYDDERLLKIAQEIQQAETAFIQSLGNDLFHLRWFSKVKEVELCGHATLAAAHILWQEGIAKTDLITFQTLSGSLQVTKSDAGITMNFPIKHVTPCADCWGLHSIINCSPLFVGKVDRDIFVEIDPSHIRDLTVNLPTLQALDCRALIVTAKGDEKDGHDFICRLFAPSMGIPEDAVSAASHCKLASYWQKKTGKTLFRSYQASPRGGEVVMAIEGERVLLTGHAVTVMKGVWLG